MCSEEKCRECKWKCSCANNCEKPPCYAPKEAAPVYVPYKIIPEYPNPQYPPCGHVFPWWGIYPPSHCPICGAPINIQEPWTISYDASTYSGDTITFS